MPECHPLPQQIRNHFFLLLWDTQSTHVHRGSWLVPLSLYPSASVLFHLRSVSSHSFEVAVRGFPKDKRPLLVKCILGIVNRSEQSGQRGTTRQATPPQATPALSFTPDLLASGHHLPTPPFSSNKQYFVFAGYHLPFIPTILPFCHPDRQHQRE